MKKKVIIPSYLFLMLLLSFISFYPYVVGAESFTETFNSYPDGTTDFDSPLGFMHNNQTNSFWNIYRGVRIPTNAYSNYHRIFSGSSKALSFSGQTGNTLINYCNFTSTFSSVNFSLTTSMYFGGANYYSIKLMKNDGDKIAEMRIGNVGLAGVEFLNDASTTITKRTLNFTDHGDALDGFRMKIWINLYESNSTVEFILSAENDTGVFTPHYCKFSPSNFELVQKIEFEKFFQDVEFCYIDNLGVETASAGTLWDLAGIQSVGDVDATRAGVEQKNFGDNDEHVWEIERRNFVTGDTSIYIHQVALQVGELTDFNDFDDFLLAINGEFIGDFTRSYSITDGFILVWENINRTIIVDDDYGNDYGLLIEFEIFGDSGETAQIALISTDIDGDGDTEYKTTEDYTGFNGQYGGTYTDSTSDLCYEVWYTGEGGEEIPGDDCGNFSQFTTIGSISAESPLITGNIRQLEIQHNVPLDADVYGLDLYVTDSYGTSSLGYYGLAVSSYGIGNPSCIYRYESGYIMRWDFVDITGGSVKLEGERPLLEITASTPLYATTYWEVYTANQDLDQDGDIEFRTQTSVGANGQYDGDIINEDIAYILYHDNLTIVEDCGLADSISTSGAPYFNYDPIFLSYSLNTNAFDNEIVVINRSDATEEFRRPVSDCSGDFSFIVKEGGSYRAIIERNSVEVAGYNFEVGNSSSLNFKIWTDPNPSAIFEEFCINYRYYHPNNRSGVIYVTDDLSITTLGDALFSTYIDGNNIESECEIKYTYTGQDPFIYVVLGSINNGQLSILDTVKQYIRSTSGLNYIKVNVGNGLLDENGLNEITVFGFHSFTSKVVIRLNGGEIRDVTGDNEFTFQHDIREAGHYNLSLWAVTDNGSQFIDSVEFSIGAYPGEAPSVLPRLEPALGALIGVVITISITLFPLLMVGAFGFNIEVPPLAYAICAGVGIVFSIYLGFFDFWVLLFIAVIAVAILLLQYWRGDG